MKDYDLYFETSIPETTLTICAWPDPVIDTLGHDPRSAYVETYWLGILGPSTTWLARRLVAGLEAEPDGFQLELAECARSLGLGDRGGRHSPFRRALGRMVQFDLARWDGACSDGARSDGARSDGARSDGARSDGARSDGARSDGARSDAARSDGGPTLAVRRRLPPLNRQQVARLPESLRQSHTEAQEAEARLPAAEHLRRRSRQLALSLVELGEDLDSAERQLLRWRFAPAVAREAAAWAWDRHRGALASLEGSPGGPAEARYRAPWVQNQ